MSGSISSIVPLSTCGTMPPRQQALIARFVAACQADERVVASFLGGSYANGTADEYSDVDLCLVTTDAAFDDFFANRDAFVRLLGDPVFLEDYANYGFALICFILTDSTEAEIGLASESRFDHIHVGPFRVLVDKTGILSSAVFPERNPEPAVQTETLRSLLCWFWHDVSHVIEDIGRRNLWSAHSHLDDLRLTCVTLACLARQFGREARGYDKVESFLPGETLAALEATFCPHEPAAMLGAALSIVQFYQRVAPELARTHGAAYPYAVERIMSKRLEDCADRFMRRQP